MYAVAVLCLAAVALARPETPVTTVTERTLHLRGDAEKYYGQSYYAPTAYQTAYHAAAPVTTYSHHAAAPVEYHHAVTAAPVEYHHAVTAAPVEYHHAVTAAPVEYHHAVTAAPVTTYNTAYHAAVPAVTTYKTAAYPALSTYNTAYHAAVPAVTTYNTAAYSAPVAYNAGYYGNYYAPSLVRSEGIAYDDVYNQGQVYDGPAKVYKHVYAFAAPEEPALRAKVSIQAPVNKRKHYKLVFIKAPTQQTVVDSDITLPAQEEEKTLIYVLSKNQKQVQPEIRVKQAEASKHAKPEVFFLKYRNEAEAQAIASDAISGQNADVPPAGEIISDGSVSLLGQSDTAFRNGFGASNILYRSAFAKPIVAAVPAVPAVSQYSVGTVGIVPTAVPATVSTSAPVTVINSGRTVNFGSDVAATHFGLNNGYSFQTGYAGYEQDPASVALKVTSEPASSFEPTTASSVEQA